MQIVDSLEKALMLRKMEGRRGRGWQRVRRLDGITDSMDMNLGKPQGWWGTGKTGVLQSMGFRRVRRDLAIEQQNLLFFRCGDDWASKHNTQHDEAERSRVNCHWINSLSYSETPREDFPGGPVAKAPCSQCRGPGFNPWSWNQILCITTRHPILHSGDQKSRCSQKTKVLCPCHYLRAPSSLCQVLGITLELGESSISHISFFVYLDICRVPRVAKSRTQPNTQYMYPRVKSQHHTASGL